MVIDMDSTKKTPSGSNFHIDDFDRELIGALREDGRQSLANLGIAIGLSGDSVKDRLDRLTNLGILKVTCTVDPRVLGYSSITLLGIKVTGPAENIAEDLALLTEFDFVACTAGEFDIIAEVVCVSEVHLLHILDSHVRARADVASIVAFSYLQVLKFSPGHNEDQTSWSNSDLPQLDTVDRRIVEELQHDGRLSYQELAERIGHPYQTTRRRARALLDDGVIHPEVLVNRLVEGTAVIAGVNLRTTGPIPDIAQALAQLTEVEVAVLTTGSFDLMLEVACRDREHLAQLVGETLPAIPGVVSTETNIYLRVVKLPQSWLGLVRQL
jgi:Lrp/AsnC family transcriptional regulator for asnA, asnC and gidA